METFTYEGEPVTVYVVWTNTDLTEGRGRQIVRKICASASTAIRLAVGIGVQGGPGQIEERIITRTKEGWIVPRWMISIEDPTMNDLNADKKLKALDDAVRRAKAAGVSIDDILILTGNKG